VSWVRFCWHVGLQGPVNDIHVDFRVGVCLLVGQCLGRLVAFAAVFANELGAGFDHELSADDLGEHLTGTHDLKPLALNASFHMPADDHMVGYDFAIDLAGAADGNAVLADDGSLDQAIHMQIRADIQFATDSGALCDNRCSEVASLRFTAFAKESHGTCVSCINSAS